MCSVLNLSIMNFFFKRSKVVLDSFTHNQTAYELFPLEQANKNMPPWWKFTPTFTRMNGDFFDTSTIKSCRGVIESYQNAISIPMWSDLAVQVNDKNTRTIQFQWADYQSQCESHHQFQWETWIDPLQWGHMKIISPWMIHTKDDVRFMMVDPVMNRTNFQDYTFLHGAIDFKHNHSCNVNTMVSFGDTVRDFKLTAGTTLALLVPLSEREVVVKTHLVNKEEYDRKKIKMFTFNGIYQANRKLAEKKSKCPFGFSK